MAQFNIAKGDSSRISTDITPFQEGRFYLTNDGGLYVDAVVNGENKRIHLNPTTGVTSFKGRAGAVTPQDGDYTADMVGARPDTWTPSADDVGAMPAVSGGTTGQVLTKTASGQEWSDAPDGLSISAVSATLYSNNWTQSEGKYTQTVQISGVTTSARLIFTDPDTPGDDKQADEEVLQAWGAGPAKIAPSDGNGTVTFYSWTQPTINIPIQVVVIT